MASADIFYKNKIKLEINIRYVIGHVLILSENKHSCMKNIDSILQK